jgi:hypothetical protein
VNKSLGKGLLFFFTVKNRKGFTCVKKRVFYFGKN